MQLADPDVSAVVVQDFDVDLVLRMTSSLSRAACSAYQRNLHLLGVSTRRVAYVGRSQAPDVQGEDRRFWFPELFFQQSTQVRNRVRFRSIIHQLDRTCR